MKNIFLLIFGCAGLYAAPLSVRLESSVPSPQPVGTVIGLTPRAQISTPATYVFQYSISTNGGPFRIVRDFNQDAQFIWTPELFEHEARVRVRVRNNTTKETAESELPFRIEPRKMDPNGIVTRTAHPLVALFSAPSCPEHSYFRVAFRQKETEPVSHTSAQPCAKTSNNVYVAGMYADMDYELRSETVNGSEVNSGNWIPFRTGIVDGRFPPVVKGMRINGSYSAADAIIIRSTTNPWRPSATDLDGNVVWYLSAESESFVTRVLDGGHFLVLAEGSNTVNDIKRWQVVREVDLLGNTLRETNIGILAEQLESHGIHSDCKTGGKECVPGFHHEAIRLPNGHTLVIAGLERMFPAGTQGATGPVDVLGDLILDLDENLQLAWFWNAFDHLDLKRASLGKEKCKLGPGSDGCSAVFLAPEANGWLHSNSLAYVAESGDLLLSIPEQDWILKIDYHDGKGSGKILWRLGKDGDFSVKANDPYPWFSYQHDAGFDPESRLLVLFDDGHRRKEKFPQANNRGQAWRIDEKAMTATPVLNADLGVYAVAVGSAQVLSNGNYSFESGFMNPSPALGATGLSQTTETTPDGKIAYTQESHGALTYRSFRVPDLYTAPKK